ncbi:MAG: gluconate 2-dehydrogenase subunit 3 family protein [Rhodoluna sp.]
MSHDFDLDRRGLIQRMIYLVGAVAIVTPPDAVLARPAKNTASFKTRHFLDPARFATMSAIADTIIPKTDTSGALDAGVPANFDAMLLHWASPKHQQDLVGAIAEIDEIALIQEKAGFATLTPEKRYSLLSAHDIAALKPVPRLEKLTGMAALMAPPSIVSPAYGKMKELMVLLYYYSEAALTTELDYEHVPGGWTPSVKVTPQTRATGGLGMF